DYYCYSYTTSSTYIF
nr:immunoglobulin light chain junction region [Macaca mulatta]MOW04095.1 immunoglobulin light chain junction region [Macaca mulatta]MOW04323.1 immunoglobulin light chain junction region [Macaca mulatta]MOW04581.1 immunoglobulin light chain junction region [Macaca mulatta]MOW05098.1 immunoglobulin light chain junction region [Macaca mulatta]